MQDKYIKQAQVSERHTKTVFQPSTVCCVVLLVIKNKEKGH